MEDLKIRIRELMQEIEHNQLKTLWVAHLIANGIEEREAYTWAAEIGHVIEAYESSLIFLVALFQRTGLEHIPDKINDWAAFTHSITVFKLEDSMQYLQERLKPYLPPDSEDNEAEA